MSVKTPISDFIDEITKKDVVRLFMPGHKGVEITGPEKYDITEIHGADSLYSADGIIAESEKICSGIFGSKKTIYSTEGSSQCIKAMIHLLKYFKKSEKIHILAARNVHKSFLYACALSDCEVDWIASDELNSSVCSCRIRPETVEEKLRNKKYDAVYLTSPDYLGNISDIESVSDICHRYGALLLVDNAHGAYLHFLPEKMHPLDLGADMCCDSAHKTLPVLTSGAYLHLSAGIPDYVAEKAKDAMEMFGSTSPSYLVLKSLDVCNKYLDEKIRDDLRKTIEQITKAKQTISDNGWKVCESEPLKIVIQSPKSRTGYEIADMMRRNGIECEFCDKDFVTCMVSTFSSENDIRCLVKALGKNNEKETRTLPKVCVCETKMSIREALFSTSENISVDDSLGRICSDVKVSCPPAVPIVMPGEIVNEDAVELLKYYGISKIDAVKNRN